MTGKQGWEGVEQFIWNATNVIKVVEFGGCFLPFQVDLRLWSVSF